jgi:hypothetical protein
LIYENWLSVLASLLILFLFSRFLFLDIFLYFIFLWHFRGSLLQSFFYSLFFLPSAFYFSQGFIFFKFLIPILFFILFFSFKKNKIIDWVSFFAVLFLFFLFNFWGRLDISLAILFSTLALIYFSSVFLNKELLLSLIISLIFLESAFLVQFFPFSFWTRALILFLVLGLYLTKIRLDIFDSNIEQNKF